MQNMIRRRGKESRIPVDVISGASLSQIVSSFKKNDQNEVGVRKK